MLHFFVVRSLLHAFALERGECRVHTHYSGGFFLGRIDPVARNPIHEQRA